jgi:hypothetical protein
MRTISRSATVLFILGMNCSHACADDREPILHYAFDEGTATDASGTGNDGTIHGAEFVASPRGRALRFDGSDDFVECGTSEGLKQLERAGTLELWVKPEVLQGGLFNWSSGAELKDQRLVMVFNTREGQDASLGLTTSDGTGLRISVDPAGDRPAEFLFEQGETGTKEAMCFLPAGDARLIVRADGPCRIDNLTARSIPEIFHHKLLGGPKPIGHSPETIGFMKEHVRDNINTFVGPLYHPEIQQNAPASYRRLKSIHAMGTPDIGEPYFGSMEEAYEYITTSDSIHNEFSDGIIFDEFAGTSIQCAYYADAETTRWFLQLHRHYGIEGSTEPLTGDPYEPGHIQNGDFLYGTEGWTLSPAEEGSIRPGFMRGLGHLQARKARMEGASFLVTRRGAGKPNVFSRKSCTTTSAWYRTTPRSNI